MSMKCIIIDDEPLALNIIKSYCDDLGTLDVVKTCTNAVEGLQILCKEDIDLVFCDIEMPQINGIDLIKAIDQKPMFIFTTAYPQYALEGFELNAIDYLVKPIPFARFVKAVNRAQELFQLKNKTAQENTIPASGSIEPLEQFIFVKSEYDNIKLKLEEIKYIQGLKDYLKIHTHVNKPILTLMNFKDMQAKLPSHNFLRVHRSFIVNLHMINSIQRSKVVIDDVRIPIGDSYKESVYRRLGI